MFARFLTYYVSAIQDFIAVLQRLPFGPISMCLFVAVGRSSHQKCSVKKVFLKVLQNLLENTCARVTFLIKFQAKACNCFKKETPAQVISYEILEIFKNAFLTEHLRTNASEPQVHTIVPRWIWHNIQNNLGPSQNIKWSFFAKIGNDWSQNSSIADVWQHT